jgi:hypothetical protein
MPLDVQLIERDAKIPLPPCGGELERGVHRRAGTSKALTPPSLTLPHKGGGKRFGLRVLCVLTRSTKLP